MIADRLLTRRTSVHKEGDSTRGNQFTVKGRRKKKKRRHPPGNSLSTKKKKVDGTGGKNLLGNKRSSL